MVLHTNDPLRYQETIDIVLACATANAHCVSACIGNPDMVRCAETSHDCADLCYVFARVLATESDAIPSLAQAVAEVAARARDESQRHAEFHDHCRQAAATARACIDACGQFMKEAA